MRFVRDEHPLALGIEGIQDARMTSWMRMTRQRSRAKTTASSRRKPKGLSNSSDRLRPQ